MLKRSVPHGGWKCISLKTSVVLATNEWPTEGVVVYYREGGGLERRGGGCNFFSAKRGGVVIFFRFSGELVSNGSRTSRELA